MCCHYLQMPRVIQRASSLSTKQVIQLRRGDRPEMQHSTSFVVGGRCVQGAGPSQSGSSLQVHIQSMQLDSLCFWSGSHCVPSILFYIGLYMLLPSIQEHWQNPNIIACTYMYLYIYIYMICVCMRFVYIVNYGGLLCIFFSIFFISIFTDLQSYKCK